MIKQYYMVVLLVCALCFFPVASFATISSESVSNEHSEARLLADRESVTPGDTFWVALHLDMRDDWHTYWINPGDSGIPTNITFDLPDGVTVSELHWPVPIQFEMSGIVNFGYKDDAYHFLEVSVPEGFDGSSLTLNADASWLICDDICVPESASLTLTLPVSEVPASMDAAFHELRAAVPREKETQGGFVTDETWLYATLPALQLTGEAAAFIRTEGVAAYDMPPDIRQYGEATWLRWPVGSIPADSIDIVVRDTALSLNASFALARDTSLTPPAFDAPATIDMPSSEAPVAQRPLLLVLGFAFLGGLILNLMPCVLPVLSLKALSLVNLATTSRALSVQHGLAYLAGILISFLIIGAALIVLQHTGMQLGWGFQLQSAGFVACLTLVLAAVGLNLSGVFELPSLFAGVGQERAARHTPSGSFFTGMLAVLVATPCLAPFMATAVGYALAQPPAILLLIFAMIGAGLAAPFVLISAVPAAARMLPKPGAWMVRFKQLLAFPMYATAAWLVWVVTQQTGTSGLALMLQALLLLSLVLWLLSWTTRRAVQWLLVGILLAGSVYYVQRMQALPPAGAVLQAETSDEVPFSTEALAALRQQQQPIFFYATADWCLICKVNEKTTLHTDAMQAIFADKGITVMRADWTDYNDEILVFLQSHGQGGVPLYLYYPPGGEPVMLPQLLSVGIVADAIR